MWRTVFIIDHKDELRPDLTFPAFAKHGELVLYKSDKFDSSRVPFRYNVTQVIFDVLGPSPAQYVHLTPCES